MSDRYISLEGKVIAPGKLRMSKAKDMVRALRSGLLDWVRLIECRRVDSSARIQSNDEEDQVLDVVIFDVDVEVPQRKVFDIHRVERIAVGFSALDKNYPETVALREDFPLVPHRNIRLEDRPVSLCLFDEPYSEIKLRWTAQWFIECIRTWLAKTATGTLHAADQRLEPLLLPSTVSLVLPSEFITDVDDKISERLTVFPVFSGPDRYSLVARRSDSLGGMEATKTLPQFVTTVIQGDPQPHGIIRRHPRTLRDLHEFLRSANIDLLSTLRERLRSLREDKRLLDATLIIIVILPKTRDVSGRVEAYDTLAFMLAGLIDREQTRADKRPEGFLKIREVGRRVGVWEPSNGVLGALLPMDVSKQGDQITVGMLNPCFTLTRQRAARLNGLATRYDKKITAVGAGALGSQVFLTLIREAFGEWVLIDKDLFLPHNSARHVLYGIMVGYAKVEPLADIANDIIDGKPIAAAVVADVLDPGLAARDVEKGLKEADVIFDFSASIAVARHLSHDVDSAPRRISVFLNPSGSDLVVLAEDGERRTRLASLEMQYYRFLTLEPALRDHLRGADGKIRYGLSCRDLSSTISEEHVALHAATASRALRRVLEQEGAAIAIWEADDEDITVKTFRPPPSPTVEMQRGDWTLCTDGYLMDKVRRLRSEKLPVETGGVLMGSFDMQHKIVYVVDSLPSPPDSQERRTSYIRGNAGLQEQVEGIKKITGGHLSNVGEWHSHPTGYGCAASGDDRKLFRWIEEQMARDGLPPVMLILGDDGQAGWHVGRILD